MAVYKLKAKSNYGNMPKGYEFLLVSATIPTHNAADIEKEIIQKMLDGKLESFSAF